eukprot:2812902-Rhodomonas_salina.1
MSPSYHVYGKHEPQNNLRKTPHAFEPTNPIQDSPFGGGRKKTCDPTANHGYNTNFTTFGYSVAPISSTKSGAPHMSVNGKFEITYNIIPH